MWVLSGGAPLWRSGNCTEDSVMWASIDHHPEQVARDDAAVWDLPFPVRNLSPMQSLNSILIGFPAVPDGIPALVCHWLPSWGEVSPRKVNKPLLVVCSYFATWLPSCLWPLLPWVHLSKHRGPCTPLVLFVWNICSRLFVLSLHELS